MWASYIADAHLEITTSYMNSMAKALSRGDAVLENQSIQNTGKGMGE